jgi:DNA-binding transcriptional MerR regulator
MSSSKVEVYLLILLISWRNPFPPIPAKRYFTIGEVSELCGVKPYVLRYWEQEFTQLKPMKRRGNRRYYQHHEVLLIRRIRELLYEQGFTISGARNRLADAGAHRAERSGRAGRAAEHASRAMPPRHDRGHDRIAGRSDAESPIATALHPVGSAGATGTAFDPRPARSLRAAREGPAYNPANGA